MKTSIFGYVVFSRRENHQFDCRRIFRIVCLRNESVISWVMEDGKRRVDPSHQPSLDLPCYKALHAPTFGV